MLSSLLAASALPALPGCWYGPCAQMPSFFRSLLSFDPGSRRCSLQQAGCACQTPQPRRPNPCREGRARCPDGAVGTAECSIWWGGIFWGRRLCGKAVEQEGVSGAARREGAVRFYLPQSKGVRAGWFSFLGTEKKKEERSARTRSRVIYSPGVSNG